jgi:polyphosphate glucokinase
MRVLVIDVGGSHVKVTLTATGETAVFDSGPDLTPARLVHAVRNVTRGWTYDVISMGYPGQVDADSPSAEPGNLGGGWVVFSFADALGRPVRIVNDATLQALGAYEGTGRMLFLGLGTGLGSTLVTDRMIVPLELGNLPHPSGDTLADRLGREGLERNGGATWQRDVVAATDALRRALVAEYVVLGGGNARRVDPLPAHARRGGNDDAAAGGERLWREIVATEERSSSFWRVVR